jgi:hypothetical protein
MKKTTSSDAPRSTIFHLLISPLTLVTEIKEGVNG